MDSVTFWNELNAEAGKKKWGLLNQGLNSTGHQVMAKVSEK